MTNDCRSCICLFASLYHPSIGGVETYTASLAHELACRGLRVIVVACIRTASPLVKKSWTASKSSGCPACRF